MKKIKLKVQLDDGAQLPTRAHDTDVGYDVKALHVTVIDISGDEYPIRDKEDAEQLCEMDLYPVKVKIDTGVHVKPEPGYWVELVPNSRLAKTAFMYGNSVGIIDPDYTGSMRVILNVLIPSEFYRDIFNFIPGKTVGQLIIRNIISADIEQVDELEDTIRGDGGFGSTEKKCGNCKHFSEEHIHGSGFYKSCTFEIKQNITEETTACPSFNK
jgi:dUTP pyrophosphatase